MIKSDAPGRDNEGWCRLTAGMIMVSSYACSFCEEKCLDEGQDIDGA